MDKLNIILNGKIVQGYKGETILELANRNEISIPTLCNDPRLEPFSSCYVCVVEVEGMRGLQPSCSTRITEGMRINTESERVKKSRKAALELLLSNHYADCVAPCKLTCPAGVDVQGYISFINKGMYKEAVALIRETNPLPAICGRVCVRPCEVACRRNLVEGKGVGIDYLKRYATDKEFELGEYIRPEVKLSTGKRVCIIGAGPAGLTSAYYLAIEGHEVEILEANSYAGGMLRYGIPPYRLPNEIIDREVKFITDLGVKIKYNHKLGDNISFKDLKGNYDAFIITIGSQIGTTIGCENDRAENVLSGIDFLRNMEITGQRYDFTGKKVAVIGGGNTAMDCCRTAVRCGAEKVYVIYRRTEKEMPANPIEIHESKLEGVEYLFLTAPARVNVDEKGRLKSLTCFKIQLGEPDASGRRRPIKIDGSEFELELDYILAAIGQKTNVNFLDDINTHSEEKFVLNKWGDIQADKDTLQTSIRNIFAAGDAVTGPATLIEAIAQGRKAARSCHQYLVGAPVKGEPYEFISRKDNFEKQQSSDYIDYYVHQEREEMPTLPPAERKNFSEVELGYSEQQAYKETLRCMECGCNEYYSCDLKKYSTEYKAVQTRFNGEYKKYEIDFRHPFIEIDNNKCILCSRCIRICKEIVGASALGLVNRGFETYVAPSGLDSLIETNCESCGMCITTCPTGAMSENFTFKPGPVKLSSFNTICNYCSTGCEITLHHTNGFFMKATGANGTINSDGLHCRFGKFGYKYLNDSKRITKPLLRTKQGFKEITFEEAFDIILKQVKATECDKNILFAGARLTNEELYLIQKFARAGLKTNNVTSFHYVGRGDGYKYAVRDNLPFEKIVEVNRIYILGSETNYENGVVGMMINRARSQRNTKVSVITKSENDRMIHKADRVLFVNSYYHFLKAVNHHILSNGLENRLFINDNVRGFDEYKQKLLTEDFNSLVKSSGVFFEKRLIDFATEFNSEMKAVIIASERHLSSNGVKELFNLALITGKLGKTTSGIIILKEKNNSQGLFDMGISPEIGVGAVSINEPTLVNRMKTLWKTKNLPEFVDVNIWESFKEGKFKNVFIFGEDPIGCAINKKEIASYLGKKEFLVVQDYFMTETAQMADLILPSSLPFEIGGSYSNTQKYVVTFESEVDSKISYKSYEQVMELMKKLGVECKLDYTHNITLEISSLLSPIPLADIDKKYCLEHTTEENHFRKFDYGCDYLVKRFEESFISSFENN